MSTACEYDAPSKNVLFLFSLGPTVAKRGNPCLTRKIREGKLYNNGGCWWNIF